MSHPDKSQYCVKRGVISEQQLCAEQLNFRYTAGSRAAAGRCNENRLQLGMLPRGRRECERAHTGELVRVNSNGSQTYTSPSRPLLPPTSLALYSHTPTRRSRERFAPATTAKESRFLACVFPHKSRG